MTGEALVQVLVGHAQDHGVTEMIRCFIAAMSFMGQRVRITMKPMERDAKRGPR